LGMYPSSRAEAEAGVVVHRLKGSATQRASQREFIAREDVTTERAYRDRPTMASDETEALFAVGGDLHPAR